MSNCKEHVLDVMAITAIPLTGVSVSDMAPTIPSSAFEPTLTNAITIGREPATTGGIVIPIRRSTGKSKDEESDSVAGRLHTVTVNCEVDERGGEIWAHQLTLERTPHHLLLTFRDETQGFVSADEDTYVCNVERDGSKTTVTFAIQNLMGIQMLIPSDSSTSSV